MRTSLIMCLKKLFWCLPNFDAAPLPFHQHAADLYSYFKITLCDFYNAANLMQYSKS